MKEIGGYFGLELNSNKEYHSSAIKLNTGRNALEYILLVNQPNRVYLPIYTCEVIIEPLKRCGIKYSFYKIDHNLEPIFDFNELTDCDLFLYTNYFGLKDDFISELSKKTNKLIIDNAQSFFSFPVRNVDTFYSPRKFFGVPDGGYLYSTSRIDREIMTDNSLDRFEHLLLRISSGAKSGYSQFQENEDSLRNQPIKMMSNLTQSVLDSIDYLEVSKTRKENYTFFENHFSDMNELKIKWNKSQTPMIYPLLLNKSTCKELFLDKDIFIAKYWPNIIDWAEEDDFELYLYKNLYALPIDQRYSSKDLMRIVSLFKKN